MADDKSKRDRGDRLRVAGGQDYEIRYLAQKTGISERVARELIKRFGNDRRILEAEARKLKGD